MRKVYICSPYKAADGAQLDRNIEYAQELTKRAIEAGFKTVKADKLQYFLKCEEKEVEAAAWDYAKISACKFCKGNKLHSCTGFDCREPYQKAYEYAIKQRFPEQEEHEEYYEEYG